VQRSFHSSSKALSTALAQHRNSNHNNKQTPFDFTPENHKKVQALLSKYPPSYSASAIIPLLWLAQEQNSNWVPLSAMDKIAQIVDVAPIRVYETCTFYTMFNREPMPKYHIQLCGTTPCQLCGAEKIKEAIREHLGVEEGEHTSDGLFVYNEVECLGACVNAPMIQVNNHEFYEDLTPESMKKLLDNWRNGVPNKVGPQNPKMKSCEGPMGQTTLLNLDAITPVCRDLDAALADITKAAADAKARGPPPPPPKPAPTRQQARKAEFKADVTISPQWQEVRKQMRGPTPK